MANAAHAEENANFDIRGLRVEQFRSIENLDKELAHTLAFIGHDSPYGPPHYSIGDNDCAAASKQVGYSCLSIKAYAAEVTQYQSLFSIHLSQNFSTSVPIVLFEKRLFKKYDHPALFKSNVPGIIGAYSVYLFSKEINRINSADLPWVNLWAANKLAPNAPTIPLEQPFVLVYAFLSDETVIGFQSILHSPKLRKLDIRLFNLDRQLQREQELKF